MFFLPAAGENGTEYPAVLQGTRSTYFGYVAGHRETADILGQFVGRRASQAQLVPRHEHGRLRQAKHTTTIHIR